MSASAVGTHVWTASGTEGGTHFLNKDGTSIASGLAPNTGETPGTACALSIGAYYNCGAAAQNFFSGSIEEIVVYSSVLSTTNSQLIEGYLACKWSLQRDLPSSHPYHAFCPTAGTNAQSVAGLSAWYDASNSASITAVSNAAVTTWNDLSGHGETLAQAAAGNQPTHIANCVNGLGCVSFNGSSDNLLSNDTNYARLLLPASTVFVVQNADNDTQTSATLSMNIGGTNIRYGLQLPYSSAADYDLGDPYANRLAVSTSAVFASP